VSVVRAAALVCAFAIPSALASGKPADGTKDWSVTIGAGGLYSPDYEGSDDYEFRGLPYLAVQYQDWLSFSVPEGLKASLIRADGFKAGLLLGYRFDRDAGDNIALAGWGGVDGAFEVGAFAEYKTGPFKLEFDVRHDVSDAHDGTIATLGARYSTRVGFVMVSAGPYVTWTDGNYNQTYFGITAAQAASATLAYAPYSAGGGIEKYGLSATVLVPLSEQLAVTGLLGASQLTGDAADSPIVRVQGDETQFMAGLFVGYRF
jgi:outer membrane scaffolding protein for murein synthesis (MipA/OmpV family)